MDNEYNIPVVAQTPEEDPGYNIPVAADPTLPPEIASQRASKAVYGVSSKVGGDYNDYYQAFVGGQENSMRNIVVNRLRELNMNRMLTDARETGPAFEPAKWDIDNDPRSVFEDHYAQRYMDHLNWPVGKENSNWLQQAYEYIPELTRDTINLGTEYKAREQFFQTRYEDAQARAHEQSWLGWGVDEAKSLSVIYSLLKNQPWARDAVISNLWTAPRKEAMDEYDKYISTLNPGDARQFAADVIGQRDRFLETVLPVLGVEGGIASGVISKQLLINMTRKAVRDQVQGAITTQFPELSASVTAGDLATATKKRAWGDIVRRQRRADPYADALEDLPNMFKIGRQRIVEEQAANKAYGVETAGAQQLIDQYDAMIQKFPQMVADLTRPETMPALAEGFNPALEAAQEEVKNRNKYFSPILINTSKPYRVDPFSRAWFVDLIGGRSTQEAFGSAGEAGRKAAEMGLDGFEMVGNDIKHEPQLTGFDRTVAEMASAKRFTTEAEARTFAESSGIKNYTVESTPEGSKLNIQGLGPKARIEQSGSGWYIIKPVAVDETAPALRQYAAHLNTDRTPVGGVLNSFLSRMRTPEETLSEWMNKNRKAATFTSSVIERYAYEQFEAVRKLKGILPGGKWDEFNRMMNSFQKIRDPVTGEIGYTPQTINEFNMQYLMKLSRLPDAQEIAAFGALKRVNEMNHALDTIRIIRSKYRRGAMSHRFYTTSGMDQVKSPEFDGMSMAEFPAGHTGDTIAIVGDTPKDIKIKTIGRMGKIKGVTAQDYWDYRIKTGQYKAIELYAPSQNPLSGYGPIKDEHQVRFVLVKSAQASDKPLDWTAQLPWRGGGHFVPKFNQYIKQIAIKTENIDGQTTHYATGVNTFAPVVNGVEGRAIIKHLEDVRRYLSKTTASNIAAARDIVENTLHMNWEEVYGMFRPIATRGADGRMMGGSKPIFNVTEPFQLVDVNKNLINMDREGLAKRYEGKGKFVDATTHGDAAIQDMIPFSQERDFDELMHLDNKGTTANPAYSWEAAPMLDAIPMMERAMTKTAHSFMMDEVKQQAVESWVREASAALKAGGASESELQSSPLYWFHRGDLRQAVGINAQRVSELETARMQIKQFVGQVSEQDAITHMWSQRLADSVYERYPSLGKMIDPVKTAHFLQDPTRLIRAMTFHLKMGLGSIPQILVQGQTFTNIFGIAGPIRASQGTFATLVWQMSRVNPNVIPGMEKYAVKMGWKQGEITQALKDANNSGFLNVGREYSLRDNPMANRFVQTAWGKFLDFGAIPFTEGEKNVRAGAWFTAWKEYAEKTGKSVMNNVDKLNIMDRAALLNGNMNRASNALYQRGWAAFPAQFLTYTIRQMEMMWGHRLTPMEKGGLLISNALMYGLPVGLGVSGLPSDFLRQNAIKNGYTPGENYFNTMVTEGIPSTIAALINGGTYYNIGERYGDTGVTPLYDVVYGNKTMWDMVLGASGSTLSSVFEAADPFYRKMMSTLRGDPDGFKITAEHYGQIAKEASSVNNTWRSIVALKTGQLITKNGALLSGKMDVFSSILMGLTGLQPQEASDVFLMSNVTKQEKEVQEWAEKKVVQEFDRAIQSYDNKDPSNGDAFMTNALAYLKMFIPDEDVSKVLTRASSPNAEIIERVRKSFGTEHVPPDLNKIRGQQYIRGIP